jgi:hypothetical protein
MGRTLPSLADLAAAFVAHYVATGEPLFGWCNTLHTHVVRAAGGSLIFNGRLRVEVFSGDLSARHVAVSARIPWNEKN